MLLFSDDSRQAPFKFDEAVLFERSLELDDIRQNPESVFSSAVLLVRLLLSDEIR